MKNRAAFAMLLVSALLAAHAQAGPRWAKNYAEGQKIASDTGRPMVILFGLVDKTKADRKCFEHDDLAMFDSVFVFIHEQLTIDKKNNSVTDALFGKYPPGQGGIRFPFVVFADEKEKQLYKADAESVQSPKALGLSMRTALIKHGPVADPRKALEVAGAVRRADVLFEKQQFGAAARLYREAVETNLKTPPVAAAKDKLAKIEDMANKELASARSDLNDKAYPEAIEKLFAIDRKFSTVKAGQEAHAELAKLKELPEAKEAYAAAEKKASGKAPDTAVAVQSPAGPPLDPFTEEDLVALDEMASPQTAQAATPGTDDADECRKLFSAAQGWIDNKEPARAKPILQKIIAQYPKTIYADQAKSLLEEMK